MWCFSCFKPPNTLDTFQAETDIALEVSQHEAEIQEALQLSLALEESSRLGEQEKEEAENKRERELAHALEEEQLASAREQEKKEEEEIKNRARELEKQIAQELKRKQFEDERMKNDEQIAKELQNVFSEVADKESSVLRDNNNVSSEIAEMSLKEKGKGKQFEENYEPLDEEDEQGRDKGKGKQFKDEVEEDEKLTEVIPSRRICVGCDSEIENGKSVDIMGVLWHPECLWCDACHKPIAIHQVKDHVSNARGKYHKPCYERFCYVCKEKKMRKYNEHPFWKERYCPDHETDGTHKCCSCERLEPRGTNYVMLGDTRWLCLECMESAIMDSHECQHLHFEIREYFEGLNMKIEKEFPFLLVEKQALNKAEKEEKIDHQYETVTRGICLSEAQNVTSVSEVTRTGPHNELIEKVTESQPVYSDCEVTAILILYGLPRLLTGYLLAHEMMHAYLRLNGHGKLNKVREEGICQVLGHMWLESQTYASTDAAIAAEASSSSRTPLASSKKGKWTGFEKKLVEFCKNQIETDESLVYGDGFRKVNEMVMNSSLKDTLKEILRLG